MLQGHATQARAGSSVMAATAEAAVAAGGTCRPAADDDDDDVVLLGPQAGYSPFAPPEDMPYQGGYRNTSSGTVYHHATTQTAAPPGKQRQRNEQANTATQTGFPKSRGVQCPTNAATQCSRPGWYQDPQQGRILEPTGQYESGAEVLARKARAATTIQAFVRGWLARRMVAAMRQAKQELEAFVTEQHGRRQQMAEQQRQYEVQRRMQPRKPADFVLLYDELAMWWGQEQARIAAATGISDTERQEARRVLLAKETKLLQTIDRLKLAAAPVVRARRTAQQLATMAAPKHWQMADGRVMKVATPGTLRAGELAAAHQALSTADGSNMDARLAALLAVKYHAKAFDSSLTREIVGLVDREADLLNRGRDPASMAGLRARLANRFLEFVQSERFDPQAAVIKPGAAMMQQQYRFTERNSMYAHDAMAVASAGCDVAMQRV